MNQEVTSKEFESINEIGQLIRDHSKGDINWKTFSIFLVGIMVCTMVLPQGNNLMPLKAGGIFPQFSSKLGKLSHIVLFFNFLDSSEKIKSLDAAEKICNKFCENYEMKSL